MSKVSRESVASGDERKEGGGIGVTVDSAAMGTDLRTDQLLFSETGGFVIEADEKNVPLLQKLAGEHGCALTRVGATTVFPRFTITSGGAMLIDCELAVLEDRWNSALPKALGGQ